MYVCNVYICNVCNVMYVCNVCNVMYECNVCNVMYVMYSAIVCIGCICICVCGGVGRGKGRQLLLYSKGWCKVLRGGGEVYHLHDLGGGSWYLCKVGHLKGTIILSRGWLSWGEGVVKVRGGHYDMN